MTNLLHLDSHELSQINIDNKICALIEQAKLTRTNNVFFIRAANIKKIDIDKALCIAHNWHVITKTFLFTTIKGLSHFAEKIEKQSEENPQSLLALQTCFTIISDDLNTNFSMFHSDAPSGYQGIHYKWWEISILEPLKKLTNKSEFEVLKGTEKLRQSMQKMAKMPWGTIIQLRIVEAIAFDICSAFLNIFSKTTLNDQKILSSKNLLWITAHLRVETIHQKKVCDKDAGVMNFFSAQEEEKSILSIAHEYVTAWSQAFADFNLCLQ